MQKEGVIEFDKEGMEFAIKMFSQKWEKLSKNAAEKLSGSIREAKKAKDMGGFIKNMPDLDLDRWINSGEFRDTVIQTLLKFNMYNETRKVLEKELDDPKNKVSPQFKEKVSDKVRIIKSSLVDDQTSYEEFMEQFKSFVKAVREGIEMEKQNDHKNNDERRAVAESALNSTRK